MTPIILYTLTIAITLFILGVGIGWILTQDSQQTTKQKLQTGIAIAVTIVWIFAVVADVLLTGYSLSPLVHAIMGAVVGYFFTDEGLSIDIGGD